MADRSGKTEQPTERRVQKARREGQFLSAREFVSALQFLVFLGLLSIAGRNWFAGFCQTARQLLVLGFLRDVSPSDLSHIAWQLSWDHFFPLALAGAVVVIL